MHTLPFLRPILSTVLAFAVPSAHSAGKEPPPKLANLLELSKGPPVADRTFKLSPEWVGTIKEAYLLGELNLIKEDVPHDLRLTHAVVQKLNRRKDGAPLLFAVRLERNNFLASTKATFIPTLPTVKALSEMSAAAMEKLFGPQHGLWAQSWGVAVGETHHTACWDWFTFESPAKMRVVSIDAEFVEKADAKEATFASLRIREGFFQPANPKDKAERRKFKSGDEIFKAQEAGRRAELRTESARAQARLQRNPELQETKPARRER